MNLTTILGFSMGFLFLSYTIVSSISSTGTMADLISIFIVAGGTLGVAILCFPYKQLIGSYNVFIKKMFFSKKYQYNDTIRLIIELAEVNRFNPKRIREHLPKNCHPMLVDGIELISQFGFSHEKVEMILENSLKGKEIKNRESIKVWKTLSKFPPVFGLLSAIITVMILFPEIAKNNQWNQMGVVVSASLVGPFFGLVLSYFFLIPTSEKLSELGDEDMVLRSIIKEGVLLIHQKEHSVFIEEYLKSFLTPGQKQEIVKIKKVS